MSGRRTKALRKEYIKQFGRPPQKAKFNFKGEQVKFDEFRGYKKNFR
jgi:hypothetical protein